MRTDILGDLALQKVGRADGKLDDFHPALDFAFGVLENLAMLGADHPRQIVDALLDNAQEPIKNAGAPDRRQRAPFLRARPRGADGLVHLGFGSERYNPSL